MLLLVDTDVSPKVRCDGFPSNPPCELRDLELLFVAKVRKDFHLHRSRQSDQLLVIAFELVYCPIIFEIRRLLTWRTWS